MVFDGKEDFISAALFSGYAWSSRISFGKEPVAYICNPWLHINYVSECNTEILQDCTPWAETSYVYLGPESVLTLEEGSCTALDLLDFSRLVSGLRGYLYPWD